MDDFVSIAELKSAKRLGLSGIFLVQRESEGHSVAFRSSASGKTFFVRSQRGDAAKFFKTLDAAMNAIEGFAWEVKVFGGYELKQQ